MTADPRRRSDEPSCWFDDGNIVLQAEQTLFKVYKGILSRESEVFKTMISLPRFATLLESEKYEDSQLVILPDQAEDVATLLRAINDYSFLAGSQSSSVYASLLTLATKYQCTQLRREIMKPLTRAFPDVMPPISPLMMWPMVSADVRITGWADATVIANAALESGTHILLPAIFLAGCFQNINTILKGSPRLKPTGRAAVLGAIPRLSILARKIVFSELFDHGTVVPRTCKSQEKCSHVRRLLIRTIEVSENVFNPFHSIAKHNPSALSYDGTKEKFCLVCGPAFLPRAIEGRQKEAWETLPQMFGLGTWAELRGIEGS